MTAETTTATAPYLAAVVQMASGEDRQENLAVAADLIATAVRRGATLVVLPELFNVLGRPEVIVSQAEAIPGPTSDWLRTTAQQHGITLVGGSLAERSPHAGKAFNTTLVYNGRGQLLATYRKRHLFDVDLPGQVCCQESAWLAPGDALSVASAPQGNLGLAICYDLRFPEHFRGLIDRQAEVLAVPAAFSLATGRDHWELLVRARAVENQCYVLAANQYGRHSAELTTYGRSLIVDPWGTVLASAADGPGLAIATIDPLRIAQVRARLPALQHRRPSSH